MNNNYTFYFDETFHTRKITFKNNVLNLRKEDSFYVGCYIGSTEWDKIKNELTTLENEYKEKLSLTDSQELKSNSLLNKNKLSYGVCSINKISMDFYIKLLSILNNRVKIHFSILNKYEFLLRNLLPEINWLTQHGVLYKPFIYSLTKFTATHPQYKICEILLSKDKDRTKRRKIIRIFEKYLIKINGINKKKSEIDAIKSLITIFSNLPMHFRQVKELKWDYEQSAFLFSMFIKEQNIKLSHLFIDEEEQTLVACKHIFGKNVDTLKSQKSIEIRVCDWVATLLSRIIVSYYKDYENARETEDLSETIHFLNNNFFDINKDAKVLSSLMIDVLLTQQNGYWSTSGSIYADNVIEFYTMLRYLQDCFDFNKSPNSEDYNLYLSLELQTNFKNMIYGY